MRLWRPARASSIGRTAIRAGESILANMATDAEALVSTATTGSTTQPAFTVPTIDSGHVLDVLRSGMAQADLLQACREMNVAVATLMIIGGVIFLLWGYYAFKTLVTLNAVIIGAWIGVLIGQQLGAPLPAALIGGFVAGVVTWPLMKYAVAIMGGLIGCVIGMSLWRSFGIDPHYAAAGGGMGLIFFGMLSFILFRTSIMMFTSLQGSLMLIFGILAVIYKFNGIDASLIDSKLMISPFVMPMAVGFAAVIGIIYQNANGNPAAPAADVKK